MLFAICSLPDSEKSIYLAMLFSQLPDLMSYLSIDLPMVKPENRVKGRYRNAAHVATSRFYLFTCSLEATREDMIIIVKGLNRSRVLFQYVFEFPFLAQVYAIARKGLEIAVHSFLDHDKTAAHFILTDLVQHDIQGIGSGYVRSSMANSLIFGMCQRHL